jgi:hypothetical protein
MLQSPRSRVVALAGLAVVLVGLLVWAGTLQPDPAAGAYAGPDWYGPDPAPFVGDPVTATGRVVATDPVRASVEYGAGNAATFTFDGVDHAVSEGRRIRAFGTLTGDRRIAVERSFTTPPDGLLYAYAVSFVAGLWTLFRVVRTWEFDAVGVGLVPRWGGRDD